MNVLINHKMDLTDTIKKHLCPHCPYETKQKGHLKTHLANVHLIGVTWFECDEVGCEYRTKRKGDLKRHLAFVHNIGVIWFECDEVGCEYKAKQKSHLKRHLESFHDLGDKICDFCVNTYFRLTKYKEYNICRKCYRKTTGHSTRVEHQMADFLCKDKDIGPYVVLKDKQLRGDSCNTRRRPDLYISSTRDLHILVECDENQHRGYNRSCEDGRIDELLDEIKQGRIIIIRWNPDSFKVDGKKQSILRKDRLESLRDLILNLTTKTDWKPSENILVYYMYYSDDSEMITKRWDRRLIC